LCIHLLWVCDDNRMSMLSDKIIVKYNLHISLHRTRSYQYYYALHWFGVLDCIRNTFDKLLFLPFRNKLSNGSFQYINHTRFHFQSNRQNLLLFYIIHA
jgi:hypothetical protein